MSGASNQGSMVEVPGRLLVPASLLLAACLWLGSTWSAAAQTAPLSAWSLDPESSLVAVVTHKEGVASGLAHEHLVAAPIGAVDVRFDPLDPGAAEVLVEFEAEDLVVDDPGQKSRWQQDLLDAGVLDGPFSDLGPKDRRKVRQSMLGPKQLDQEAYPRIRATVDRIRLVGAEATARLVFEVRGRSVERMVKFDAPLVEEARLRVLMVERFRFDDFGIKPYSALLGAIRVAEEFDLVVRLTASRRNGSGGAVEAERPPG